MCSSNLIIVALQLDFSIVWFKYILRNVISEVACPWLQYEVKERVQLGPLGGSNLHW